MSDPRRPRTDDDPVLRRIARILDAKRRDNEEALGALKSVDRSWDELNKEVDQAIGTEFDLLGAEERAVKAARDQLEPFEEGVPETEEGMEEGGEMMNEAEPARRRVADRAAVIETIRDSLDESVRAVELRRESMRSAHTAVTRFAELTREGLETLREELSAGLPEIPAAVPVAGIELPEPEDGDGDGGERPPAPAPPRATSTPLEHIRGIGPKRAERLRDAGIPDLEAFLEADTAKLVEIAGFDADVAKEEARRVLEEHLESDGEGEGGGGGGSS